MNQHLSPTPVEQPSMVASSRRAITIGLPKCESANDGRFPMTPESVNRLVEKGYDVKLQSGAAQVIHYSDNQYASNGAHIVERDEALMCDIVIYFDNLSSVDVNKMRRGAMLLTMKQYIHGERLLSSLISKYITTIAVDQVKDEQGNQPFADILSEIDGRAAISVASLLLANQHVGKGILLGGIAGVVPCEVTIIGSGIAACAAARSAVGLGATVRMFDDDVYRLRRAVRELGPMVIGSALHPQVLHNALRSADVILMTPTRQGYALNQEEVSLMKRRVLVFDLKNEGPNSPSVALSPQSAITLPSLQNERIQDRMCIVEVGQTVPRTVAMALSNAMITLLGDLMQANRHMNSISHLIQGWQDGAIVYMGKVVNKEIANRYGLRYVDISLLTQLS